MLNRREALCNGLALTALSGFPSGLALATSGLRPAVAVVDRKLPGADEMAARLGGEAAGLHVFDRDPGRVWMNVIEPVLRAEPAVITGYTSAATLFCLQYLSQQYGVGRAALAAGAAPILELVDTGESGLLDLRDPRLEDSEAALTWVLAPSRR